MRWGARNNKKTFRDCINFWIALPRLKNPTGDPLRLQLHSTFSKSRKSYQLPAKVAEHLVPRALPPLGGAPSPQGSPPLGGAPSPQGSPPPGRST